MKAARITWVDSVCTYGWVNTNAVVNKVGATIESIGYIVHEDKEHVTISTSHSDNDNWTEPLSIPKVAIKMIKRFSVK